MFHNANGNLEGLADVVKASILEDVERAAAQLLTALRINYKEDPNTKETPARIAKMLVNELCKGKYEPRPKVTDFPNTTGLDQLYTVGPISIKSLCSHHFLPFIGKCWVGILPSPEGEVLGLSKFARLADWIFCRPQIQEEATQMLANEIEMETTAAGIGLIVKSRHLCTGIRGVEQPDMFMTTSVMRGQMRDNASLKQEFMAMIDLGV